MMSLPCLLLTLLLVVVCLLSPSATAFSQCPSIPATAFHRRSTVRPSSALCSTASSTSSTTERTEAVQEVLDLATELGPVGILQSERDQERLLEQARALAPYSDPSPAKTPLLGQFDLVYSSAPGGSNGRLGPFTGKVTQEFVNEQKFINAVDLGPFRLELEASKKIRNDVTNPVVFETSRAYLFGQQLLEKDIKGGGVWKYIFMGQIPDRDTGRTKLVRVMETPSLFILTQDVDEDD